MATEHTGFIYHVFKYKYDNGFTYFIEMDSMVIVVSDSIMIPTITRGCYIMIKGNRMENLGKQPHDYIRCTSLSTPKYDIHPPTEKNNGANAQFRENIDIMRRNRWKQMTSYQKFIRVMNGKYSRDMKMYYRHMYGS
jgi:hypothetical protein